MPRVLAFGCFDDCYNIVAGYFIGEGKKLYKDIPFNHQLLMAYISYLVQYLSKPINIYELILNHRKVLFFFSFLMNLLLIFRFRISAFIFTVFYEFSKFYLFGDRFLAEGFIVYPLVYMTGIFIDKLLKKKIYVIDYILVSISTWFVLFMREPYALVAIFLFLAALSGKPITKTKKTAAGLFVLLTVLTLCTVSLPDYYFNLFVVNAKGVARNEILGNNIFGFGILKIFFYPVYVYLEGEWNVFRVLLIGINSVFILSLIIYFLVKKKRLLLVMVFFALGLSNLRVVPVGKVYYEAFHSIPWFGMFLFTTFTFLIETVSLSKKVFICCFILLCGLLGYLLFARNSYLRDKPNPQYDLLTEYGQYMQVGEVVKALSQPSQTLFVDGFDELIHWQADRPSPYKYSWFTSYMPHYPVYNQTRIAMFKKNPPDFYYGSCPKESIEWRLLPSFHEDTYQRLFTYGKPSCLHVKKSVLKKIFPSQWEKAKTFGYQVSKEK